MLDPLAVNADMPMTSSWDAESRALGTQVTYTCTPGLTTSNGTAAQQQTCTLTGWVSHRVTRLGDSESHRLGES